MAVPGSIGTDAGAAGRWRASVLLALAALVLLAGQWGRELLPPDDLREAEVAREMWEGGDFVVPHLAGLPFVEKPPGFPAVVAAAFAATGGPSAEAARAASVAFALVAVAAVFLLGRRMLGTEEGAWAAALLALSVRFCRTAHEVLLDDALAAVAAVALLVLWSALEGGDARVRRRAWTGFAFLLGLSFLVKGLVVPGLFGACLAGFVLATRRWSVLGEAFRPLPLAAFLVPVLGWVLPFGRAGGPDLLYEFLVQNQWGRAVEGYRSNVRAPWFYLADLWVQFAPGSLLLPAAVASAWRARSEEGRGAAGFLLWFGLGPVAVLSLPVAKDSVYLLPAYPAMALLAAFGLRDLLGGGTRAARAGRAAILGAGFLAAVLAAVGSRACGGDWIAFGLELWAALGLGLAGASFLRRGGTRSAACAGAGLLAGASMLSYVGPLAADDVDHYSIREPVERVVRVAGGREVLLFQPNDGVRGASGFYRNRTALEVEDPFRLAERLSRFPGTVALVRGGPVEARPLAIALRSLGCDLRVLARTGDSDGLALTLVDAVRCTEMRR